MKERMSDTALSSEAVQGEAAIKVYPFQQAPEELRELSPYGGDEDWVIMVPPGLFGSTAEDEVVRALTVCDAQSEVMADGSRVWITAHA